MNKVNVMCIGAQKAGTTTLYELFKQHPDIELSDIKEVYYFSDEKLYGNLKKFHRHYQFNPLKKAYINITPNYLCDSLALSRIREYNPKMKIIVILRNPIDRLYSQYIMKKRMNQEKRMFYDFFLAEKKNFEKGLGIGCHSAIYRSMYAQQLKDVYQNFPQSQVLIINFEDFVNNQREAVNEILRFIDLPIFETLVPCIAGTHFTPSIKWLWFLYTHIPYRVRRYFKVMLKSNMISRFDLRKISKPSGKEPIPPIVKDELIQYFAPYNRDLQEMVPFDIAHWDC